jgi:hypothetical protein
MEGSLKKFVEKVKVF